MAPARTAYSRPKRCADPCWDLSEQTYPNRWRREYGVKCIITEIQDEASQGRSRRRTSQYLFPKRAVGKQLDTGQADLRRKPPRETSKPASRAQTLRGCKLRQRLGRPSETQGVPRDVMEARHARRSVGYRSEGKIEAGAIESTDMVEGGSQVRLMNYWETGLGDRRELRTEGWAAEPQAGELARSWRQRRPHQHVPSKQPKRGRHVAEPTSILPIRLRPALYLTYHVT